MEVVIDSGMRSYCIDEEDMKILVDKLNDLLREKAEKIERRKEVLSLIERHKRDQQLVSCIKGVRELYMLDTGNTMSLRTAKDIVEALR